MGLKVLIVGAGNAGPLLALYLQRAGHVPTVCDMYNPLDEGARDVPLFFGDVGGAIALQTNGQRVLDDVGLLDELLQKSSEPFDNAVFAKIDGSSPVDVSNFEGTRNGSASNATTNTSATVSANANGTGANTGSVKSNSSGTRDKYTTVTLMRMNLQHTVGSACNRLGIRYILNSKLVSISESESGVTAVFANGSTASADVLIGADGVHSATRLLIFGEQTREVFANIIHHIGITELGLGKGENGEDLVLDHTAGFYNDRVGNHGMVFLRTSPTNSAFQVIENNLPPPTEAVEEHWRPVSNLPVESKRLAVLVEGWGAAKNHVEIVRHARRITTSPIYVVPRLPSFHKGRVLLIGDAAHAMLPHLGQGTNIAMEDAGVLGNLFASLGDDWQTVFKLYDQIRIPRIKFVSDQSNMVKAMDNASYGHFVVKVMAFASKRLGYLDKIASYNFKEEVKAALAKLPPK
ncbi:hypothetical protein HK100_012567 [Physocladia obscura]|uniref:FAD-binding domain-containing protein n=1 Tax=Physocladia obscura TaxID=109957 RepID=A0AAD5T9R0_9FUNG|nr:hypothetical protein HK100_012567 [Physocladia obscura]